MTKWLLGVVGGAFLVLVVLVFGTPQGHYVFCLMNEGRWERAQTRGELEARLWGAGARTISPKESTAGREYVPKDGERMIQYRVLGDLALDVVYDRGDRIKARFFSYE